jgi:hypothetical protein
MFAIDAAERPEMQNHDLATQVGELERQGVEPFLVGPFFKFGSFGLEDGRRRLLGVRNGWRHERMENRNREEQNEGEKPLTACPAPRRPPAGFARLPVKLPIFRAPAKIRRRMLRQNYRIRTQSEQSA